jgi:hypothetical protein
MRFAFIISLLSLGFAQAADQAQPTAGHTQLDSLTAVSASDARSTLTRVDIWQQSHRGAVDTGRISEARWMLGVYAAYRATGEATYLERLGDWTGGGNATPPIAAEATTSLLSALPLIRYNSISTDTKKGPAPAAWKSWWKNLSQPPEHSARMITGLATLAALGADTPTLNMELRIEWFQALNQQLADSLPVIVNPKTGLIGSSGKLGDQGEVLLGLASILNDLPRRDASWQRWADIARTLSTALIQRQASSGLWAENLGSGTGDLPGSALAVAGLSALLD